VELLEYNPELVRIVDEKSQAFESSLKALELLADKTGDRALQGRVAEAKERIKALEEAEAEAREASRRAEARAAAAESAASVATLRYSEEKERNAFLVAAGSLDQDTILNLHHQIIIHASDVQQGIKRMMGRLRGGAQLSKDDWVGFLEQVSFRNSQILTAARFATKGGYKQQSSDTEADLSVYVRDYIETISNLWAPRGIEVAVDADGKPVVRRFRPIEIGILIDNLVTNAAKAGATTVGFFLSASKGTKPTLEIDVADDGTGWPAAFDPPSRAFEKGVTTTDGSGLGLFHVRQVVEGLGGTIEASAEPYSDDLDGAHVTIRLPS
jgi:signal transduction histidine kinase